LAPTAVLSQGRESAMRRSDPPDKLHPAGGRATSTRFVTHPARTSVRLQAGGLTARTRRREPLRAPASLPRPGRPARDTGGPGCKHVTRSPSTPDPPARRGGRGRHGTGPPSRLK